jgi:hypothetical protein
MKNGNPKRKKWFDTAANTIGELNLFEKMHQHGSRNSFQGKIQGKDEAEFMRWIESQKRMR